MDFHAVHTSEVPLEKSGQGHTRHLMRAARRGVDHDSLLGPETDLPVHSHPYNEMFSVLDGEVEMGGTTYPR